MNIAVVASCLYDEMLINERTFVEDLLSALTTQNEGLKFLILTEKLTSVNLTNEINFELISVGSSGKSLLRNKFWWEITLPRNLKKHKAELLISFDGRCSKSLSLPQFLIGVNGFESGSGSLKKAGIIAVHSEWEKNRIVNKYKIEKEKITIMLLTIRKNQSQLNENEREKTKSNYSNGKEYFLCPGEIPGHDSFIFLLKSFSRFKKRQQSNMKLMLFSKQRKDSLKSLSAYKYRDDVLIMENLNVTESALLFASSYAVIIPHYDRQSIFNTLMSMQSNVPVLALKASPFPEYAGEAALYFEKDAEKDFADKMIRIYTDEKLRNELIKKGNKKAEQLTIEKSAHLLLRFIQKAVK
jgi:hypothetical protein